MLPIVGILTASITAASATSIVVDTVKDVNTNGHTIIDATGSISNTTFASDMLTAFANNTGGVWNFDGTAFTVSNAETITLNYGTSLTNSLVMTLGSTSSIDQGSVTTDEATSSTFGMGLQSDAGTRTFALDTPLLTLGIFVGNRNDPSRTSVLTVNYQGGGSASTSSVTPANAGPAAGSNYFMGLSGTSANPITSFSLSQSNFVRYDDLGFVTVPEPSSALLLGLAGFGAFLRRRR